MGVAAAEEAVAEVDVVVAEEAVEVAAVEE